MAQDKMLKFLVEGLTRAFDKQEDCDVMFSVDGQTIGAHRLILNIHSQVLYEMAAGWTPDKDPIAIDDMSFDSFKALLRSIYGSEIQLSDVNVLELLSASTHLKMSFLEECCVDHIAKGMGTENVCMYMNEAVNFKSTFLQKKCMEIFSDNTAQIPQKAFKKLTQPALSVFLDAERTNMLEVILFLNVRQWMEQQCQNEGLPVNGTNMRHVIGDALYKIRFPTMTVQDFANSVTTIKGLLTKEEIADTFQKIAVFDKEDIECPFSGEFRCHTSHYYMPYRDGDQLLKEKILYRMDRNEQHDIGSLLDHVKDLSYGEDMFTPSLRLILQCCADLANSTHLVNCSSLTNQNARSELRNEFLAFQEVVKTRNVRDTMTKFMDLRSKLNELHRWSWR